MAKGGALISLLHSYTDHGDPFVKNFTSTLLQKISKPFFETLSRWITEGELKDPFEEFFIELNPEFKPDALLGSGRRSEALEGLIDMEEGAEREAMEGLKVWEKKFGFRREMLPSFVNESFGRKVGNVSLKDCQK